MHFGRPVAFPRHTGDLPTTTDGDRYAPRRRPSWAGGASGKETSQEKLCGTHATSPPSPKAFHENNLKPRKCHWGVALGWVTAGPSARNAYAKTLAAPVSTHKKRTLMQCENLFSGIPPQLPEELVTVLCRNKGIRIKRIVSDGSSGRRRTSGTIRNGTNGSSFWKGGRPSSSRGSRNWSNCTRCVSEHPRPHPGHRVAWTSTTEKTVWLVVLYAGE